MWIRCYRFEIRQANGTAAVLEIDRGENHIYVHYVGWTLKQNEWIDANGDGIVEVARSSDHIPKDTIDLVMKRDWV